MKKILLLTSLFLTKFGVQAQTNLNAVTITSGKIEQNLSETGRNVTILTQKDIANLPASSVDELLKYIPGVEVQARGPMGAQANFLIRGGTYQQVLILLDGLRLNDPLTGHFNAYFPVSLPEIERIEVLRGPAAAVYGPDAVGGVIHIITKTFTVKNHTSEKQALIQTGDYNLSQVQAGAYQENARTRWSLGMQSTKTDGFPAADGRKNFLQLGNGSASFAWKINEKLRVHVRSAADYRNFSARNFYTNFSSDTAVETTTQWWNQARVRHSGDKSQTELDVAFKYNTDRYVFNPRSTANEHVTRLFNLVLNHYRTYKNVKMVLGGQIDNRNILSNDRGYHSTFHYGIYLLGTYSGVKNLTVSGSLRSDNDENYGSELLPQLNVGYTWKKITLRGSTGKTIRAADFTERYNNNNKPYVSGGSIGNPFLAAERSYSSELGITLNIRDGFQVLGTTFIRESENLIDWVSTKALFIPNNSNLNLTNTYSYAQNVRSARTSGYEIEVAVSEKIAKNILLESRLGYTNLASETTDNIIANYLFSNAKEMINGSFSLKLGNLNVGLSGLWKKRNPQTASAINAELTPEYFLMNLRTEYTLQKGLRLNLQIQNLGDVSYRDILGAAMPGRWVMGGLSLSI